MIEDDDNDRVIYGRKQAKQKQDLDYSPPRIKQDQNLLIEQNAKEMNSGFQRDMNRQVRQRRRCQPGCK